MPTDSTLISFLWTSTDGTGATATLNFNPALVRMVQRELSPIQRVHVADSGQIWVYELSSNVELVLPVEFEDIPGAQVTTPMATHGYDDLVSFIQNTIYWSREAFTVYDADSNAYLVQYMGGLETFREAGGRSQRAGRWTGTIQLRRVIP